jgi:hypothetical protein
METSTKRTEERDDPEANYNSEQKRGLLNRTSQTNAQQVCWAVLEQFKPCACIRVEIFNKPQTTTLAVELVIKTLMDLQSADDPKAYTVHARDVQMKV